MLKSKLHSARRSNLRLRLDGLSNCTFAEAFYLPMIEVISYLHANDFEVYVVTGSDRQLARQIMDAVPMNYTIFNPQYNTLISVSMRDD